MAIVGCLGDSNTRFGLPPGGVENPGPGTVNCWPEYAPTETGGSAHTWLNFALGGGTAYYPFFWAGREQYAASRLYITPPTVYILSFGTNDFRSVGLTRDQILTAYCRLQADIPEPCIIALTPDCTDTVGAHDLFIDLNSRLSALERVAGWVLVDFWTDSTAALTDGVHLTDAHQHVRAQRAIAAVNAL